MFSKLDFTNLEKIYESHKSLVYRAIRAADNRPIILKVLKEEYPIPEEISRYEQEYEITRNLQIEGVIQAYQLLKYRNRMALGLEYFGEDSLDIILYKRTLLLLEFLKIGMKIAEILDRIHQVVIIHKDINPSNIVLDSENSEIAV